MQASWRETLSFSEQLLTIRAFEKLRQRYGGHISQLLNSLSSNKDMLFFSSACLTPPLTEPLEKRYRNDTCQQWIHIIPVKSPVLALLRHSTAWPYTITPLSTQGLCQERKGSHFFFKLLLILTLGGLVIYYKWGSRHYYKMLLCSLKTP